MKAVALGVVFFLSLKGWAASPEKLRELKQWIDKVDALKTSLSDLKENFLSLKAKTEDLSRGYIDATNPCEGRLTLQTNVPVSTTDQSGATKVYFTPYQGSVCSVWTGSNWIFRRFTELQIDLATASLTGSKNYDVFIYDNSGTLALEVSAAWSSNTARTDALSTTISGTNYGIYVKNATPTRRYVGTFRTNAGGNSTEDTMNQRFVWNLNNQIEKKLYKSEAANSWAFSTNSWTSANGSTLNRVEFVIGLDIAPVEARVLTFVSGTSGQTYYAAGLGLDSTSAVSSTQRGTGVNTSGSFLPVSSEYVGYTGIGYHYLQWIEITSTAAGVTVIGDNNNPSLIQAGILGSIHD